jgi:hypothetical protein
VEGVGVRVGKTGQGEATETFGIGRDGQGIRGVRGVKGLRGVRGVKGLRGVRGVKGLRGVRGLGRDGGEAFPVGLDEDVAAYTAAGEPGQLGVPAPECHF